MNKKLLTEMSDEDLMELDRLLTRAENALKQKKPMTEDAEDEAFNSASKYAAWLETENRMLREARKPITKREMLTWYDELRPKSVADFVLGFRCAEKHHGIGVNQSDPDSIDLQSRCRGDKP